VATRLILGDVIETLEKMEDNTIDCVVTSPPYNKKGLLGKKPAGNQIWHKHQIDYNEYGDDMPEQEYQDWMVAVIDELWRVLTPEGSIFFNHKPRRHQNTAHLPTDFISRSKAPVYQLIIWDRRNSPNIRGDILVPCTEHIYWLRKDKPKVFRKSLDKDFRGEVWVIPPKKQGEHPAPFPEKLVENCLLLATEEGDTILDPFMGGNTTGLVAAEMNRDFVGIEIDQRYYDISSGRLGVLV